MINRAEYPTRIPGEASLKRRQSKDQWSGVEGERELRRTFTIPYDHASASWETYIPAFGTALTNPTKSYMLFEDFDLAEQPNTCGDTTTAELTLTYAQSEPDPAADPVTLPADEIIELATSEEVSIAAHPDFADDVAGWGNHSMEDFWWDGGFPIIFLPEMVGQLSWVTEAMVGDPFELEDATALPDELKGITSYLVGTGQLREVAYSLTEPAGWIASDAGKRTTAPTGYPGTAANWIILSGEVRPHQNGAYYSKSLLKQWSARDFSSNIYDAA